MKVISKIILSWIIFWYAASFLLMICPDFEKKPYNNIYTESVKEYTDSTKIYKDSLINEIEAYMGVYAPGHKLSVEHIIDSCAKYDIDIIFVLAQGHLESGFGTKGIASRTNSVWNVGSFDGYTADKIIRSGRGYKHPNYSIGPYIKLLRTLYLVNGKTEEDLMRNFISHTGHRYASSTKYERQLKYIHNKIKKETNIDTLYKNYKSL